MLIMAFEHKKEYKEFYMPKINLVLLKYQE